MSRLRGPLAVAGLALVVAAAGCGKGPVRISGVVTLEGAPLSDVRVVLTPVAGGRPAHGQTDGSGQFTITTLKPNDGAMPGEYKVTVEALDKAAANVAKTNPNDNPRERAQRASRSSSKELNDKRGIHPNYTNVEKTPLTLAVPPRGDVRFDLNKDGK